MNNYKLAETAVEINEIFNNMSNDLLDKIPVELKDLFKQIASNSSYEFYYDTNKTLDEQHILPYTRIVLALIYKECICNDIEKQEYIQKYNTFLSENEILKKEKYNPENVFKNQTSDIAENNLTDTYLIEKNTSLLQKIILKVKTFFKI